MVKGMRVTPRGSGTEVERPRLIRRLRQLTSYRIAAVIAPAGYGKTTLLQQFLAAEKRRVVQVRFVATDSDFESIVRRMCVDAAVAAPEAQANLAAALRSTYQSATRSSDLARWFLSHLLDDGILLAVDDIHCCTDPDAAAFLQGVVSAETSNNWLLLGRGELDFPFVVWTATGEMDAPLVLDELEFTGDDISEYASAAGAELNDAEIDEIRERTGGWPMAAAFAVRSADRHAKIPALGATRDLIFGYFARETFGSLNDDSRDAVIVAAELPEIDVSLLEAAGFSAARFTFLMLAQRTSFVRRDGPDVYRLHDLFREFLFAQRDHLPASERFEAVATQLVLRGRPAAALRVFRSAGSHAGIAHVLERFGFDLLENGEGSLVAPCLAALAGSAFGGRSAILALRAMLASYAGSNARADADYRRALEEAPADQRVPIGLRYAQWLVATAEPQRALDVLDGVAPDASDLAEEVEADGIGAMAYALANDAAKAEPRSRRSVAAARSLGDPATLARALQRSAYVAYCRRNNVVAEEDAHEAIRICDEIGNSFIAARTYSILAAIANGSDEHRRAIHYARQIFTHAGKIGDGAAQRNALVIELTVTIETGDFDRAAQLRTTLQNFFASRGFRETATQRLSEATFFIATHRYAEAQAVLSELESVELRPPESALHAALETAVAIAVDDDVWARKAYRMASRWLSRVRDDALSNDDRRVATVVRILLAGSATWLGRESEARTLLDDHTRRTDTTPATEQLARRVRAEIENVRTSIETPLLGYLAVAKVPIDKVRMRRSESPLTRMEAIVLQHLAHGETDKEIAAALGLRPSTVSNHVKAITVKLNCRGRYRAVVVARELGLLAAESPAG